MRRSALQAKFYKDENPIYERMYKKQKNFCSRLYKRERRKFYNNFDLKDFTDNKRFWTAIKPFLSEDIYQNRLILKKGIQSYHMIAK